MKFSFWSVGKIHEPYVKAGIEDFTQRIQKYFPVEWNTISPPRNAGALTEEVLKKQEANTIFQQLSKEDCLILLDERGKQFNSPELAILIQHKANSSIKKIVFLIGGAYGIHASVMQRADVTWSLSKLVFPHMLVRLILAEQVYRACTILRNEKYHHC